MQTDEFGNPILAQFSEEGFVDCVLRIVERTDSATSCRLRLSASHEGRVVGMYVEVIKGISAGFDADMNLNKEHVYQAGVSFLSSGEESDRLLGAIASLYELPSHGLKMAEQELFTAIALHQGPLDMEQEPVKLKLFGRDASTDAEDDYYESFFNLDLANQMVYWNEKDQECRVPLVRGLSRAQT